MPHPLVGQHVWMRISASTVECLFKGSRVAVHVRSFAKRKYTTLAEHMPKAHRRHMQWTPGRLLSWGQAIGTGTRAVVQWQLDHRPHPEQGYRACLGLLNLSRTYGEERLEAACRRALAIGAPHRTRILEILKANLDRHPDLFPAAGTAAATASRTHQNVRGADYFRDAQITDTTLEGDDEACLSNPRSIH